MVLTFEEYMAKRILTEEGHNFTNHDFMQETGSNMQGVEWGLKTIQGHHGIWIKVSNQ